MKSILTLILTLAGLALVFFVAKPFWEETASLRKENIAITTTLNKLKELQGTRDELLSTYNSIPRDKIDRLNEFLPEKSGSGNLLVTLETLTGNQGIRLRKVEFEGKQDLGPSSIVVSKNASPVNFLNYSFTFSAGYESFKTFLAIIEKNLRLIDITDISFSAGDTNLLEFTLKAKSYYQKSGDAGSLVADQALANLNKLKTIKLDTSFFSDAEFSGLQEVPRANVGAIQKGRTNPFIPLSRR